MNALETVLYVLAGFAVAVIIVVVCAAVLLAFLSPILDTDWDDVTLSASRPPIKVKPEDRREWTWFEVEIAPGKRIGCDSWGTVHILEACAEDRA